MGEITVEKMAVHGLIDKMLLTDRAPDRPPDAIYVPGLSEGMLRMANPDLLDVAVGLANRYICPIAYNGAPSKTAVPQHGWPGAKYYEDRFRERGVTDDRLVRILPGLHTRSEVDELVHTCTKRKWMGLLVVTVPYITSPNFFCVRWGQCGGSDTSTSMRTGRGCATGTPRYSARRDERKSLQQPRLSHVLRRQSRHMRESTVLLMRPLRS